MLRNTLDRIGHGARRAGGEDLDALEQLRERLGATGESQGFQLAGFATDQSELLTDRIGAGAPVEVEAALQRMTEFTVVSRKPGSRSGAGCRPAQPGPLIV